jgi:hypothetical protein
VAQHSQGGAHPPALCHRQCTALDYRLSRQHSTQTPQVLAHTRCDPIPTHSRQCKTQCVCTAACTLTRCTLQSSPTGTSIPQGRPSCTQPGPTSTNSHLMFVRSAQHVDAQVLCSSPHKQQGCPQRNALCKQPPPGKLSTAHHNAHVEISTPHINVHEKVSACSQYLSRRVCTFPR